MPAVSICTPADVIQRFGNAAGLVQCLPDGTDPTAYDTARLAALIRAGSELFASYANVQVDVQALAEAIAAGAVSEWPYFAVDASAWLTVGLVWDSGTAGQAKPENVKEREKYVRDVLCVKMAKREISLGAPTQYPGTNQLQTRVDADPSRNRLMRGAFRVRGGYG